MSIVWPEHRDSVQQMLRCKAGRQDKQAGGCDSSCPDLWPSAPLLPHTDCRDMDTRRGTGMVSCGRKSLDVFAASLVAPLDGRSWQLFLVSIEPSTSKVCDEIGMCKSNVGNRKGEVVSIRQTPADGRLAAKDAGARACAQSGSGYYWMCSRFCSHIASLVHASTRSLLLPARRGVRLDPVDFVQQPDA